MKPFLTGVLVTLTSCGELAPNWEGSNLITFRLDGVRNSSVVTSYLIWWTPTFTVAAVTQLVAEDPRFRRDYGLYHPPPAEALHEFSQLGVRGRAAWGTAITVVGGDSAIPMIGEPGQSIGAKLDGYAPQPLFYFEDSSALPGGADYYHLPANAAWSPVEPANSNLFIECPVDQTLLQNPATTFLFLSVAPSAGFSVLSTIAPSCAQVP